ncbi:GNAT family N-acetyltransferase [Leptothoe sp. LEGE 181152]|uniref:N-acetyltransferase n=1 Tax=Adonisia turfae CCMR0081 TaxID=2292702 RepID=A0A6M0RRE5_9CYAN|nr:GNAT family N-acetyltransferase [Adonisia turfae]MDV3348141.1 GNAT family N-acetyltransferase [Leptothoe sp. LEGE 181152]NEZ58342.1 N-acetyltransferase [Adonisia turfae CCMR0081]
MQPFPTTLPELKTRQFRLRSMSTNDKASLFAIYGDPEVMRFASDETFSTPATVDEMLSSVSQLFQEQTSMEWGIERRTDHTLIGTCGLHSFDLTNNSAEVGCMLTRSAWGHGYMQEALRAVIWYAFCDRKITRLRADIDTLNHRSIRLFSKLGFIHQGGTIYVCKPKCKPEGGDL